MNRKIIFRGKSVDKKEWIYGSLLIKGQYSDIYLIGGYEITSPTMNDPCGDTVWTEDLVIPSTVSQLTGFKDKNNKDIYEGDIITFNLRTVGSGNKTKTKSFNVPIVWDIHEANFSPKYPHNYGEYRFYDSYWYNESVIGNIYDNPELISQ